MPLHENVKSQQRLKEREREILDEKTKNFNTLFKSRTESSP